MLVFSWILKICRFLKVRDNPVFWFYLMSHKTIQFNIPRKVRLILQAPNQSKRSSSSHVLRKAKLSTSIHFPNVILRISIQKTTKNIMYKMWIRTCMRGSGSILCSIIVNIRNGNEWIYVTIIINFMLQWTIN